MRLRDYATQMERGRSFFDLKLHDGLVKPMPEESPFQTPNGMSLRPATQNMEENFRGFKGEPTVYRMQKGMQLPEPLVVYHEHTDHYSLQTQKTIKLLEFNEILSNFLQSLPSQTRHLSGLMTLTIKTTRARAPGSRLEKKVEHRGCKGCSACCGGRETLAGVRKGTATTARSGKGTGGG